MIFGSLFDTFQRVLFLTRDTQENTTEIKELREEVQNLSDEVKRLAFEIERLKEANRYERANLMLPLNNTLLQFERRLPPDSKSIQQFSAETV